MQAKEYEVTDIKISDFRDSYNNTWCDMVLMGFGEPVKIVLKDPSTVKIGDKLYGTVNETKSKAGKTYYKFKKEQRPDYEQRQEKSDEYWAEKDASIRAQFAIKGAIELVNGQEEKPNEVFLAIEQYAKELFSMVDRVSGKVEAVQESEATLLMNKLDSGVPINFDELPY